MPAPELAHSDPDDAPALRRFEALYRGQFAFVWSAARHFGVPPGALEDVVQDVFLAAYRRLDHLRFEVSPRAWLFGVTRHVSSRYRRGADRWTRRHSALAELVPLHTAPPQLRHDDAQQLEHLLARLGDNTRAVWQMTELLGMSAPEIASELGVPLNTVYSRLRLARAQLQAQLADPSQLAAWRDGARRRHDPPASARQRGWALLLPTLGDGGASLGAGLLAWVKTQTGMATTLLATATFAVGLTVRTGAPPAPRPATPPAAVTAAHETTPPPTQPPPAIAAPVDPIPAPPSIPRGSPKPAEVQARLAEEIAMIDRARAQLAAADLFAAQATLAAHAQQFHGGALADVRAAAQVDVACRVGDASGAEAIARRLVIDHPTSAVAQRLANYHCPR